MLTNGTWFDGNTELRLSYANEYLNQGCPHTDTSAQYSDTTNTLLTAVSKLKSQGSKTNPFKTISNDQHGSKIYASFE